MNPWTDPITGAVVTGGLRIVTVNLDGRTRGYIMGEHIPAPYAEIVERWKEARDE